MVRGVVQFFVFPVDKAVGKEFLAPEESWRSPLVPWPHWAERQIEDELKGFTIPVVPPAKSVIGAYKRKVQLQLERADRRKQRRLRQRERQQRVQQQIQDQRSRKQVKVWSQNSNLEVRCRENVQTELFSSIEASLVHHTTPGEVNELRIQYGPHPSPASETSVSSTAGTHHHRDLPVVSPVLGAANMSTSIKSPEPSTTHLGDGGTVLLPKKRTDSKEGEFHTPPKAKQQQQQQQHDKMRRRRFHFHYAHKIEGDNNDELVSVAAAAVTTNRNDSINSNSTNYNQKGLALPKMLSPLDALNAITASASATGRQLAVSHEDLPTRPRAKPALPPFRSPLEEIDSNLEHLPLGKNKNNDDNKISTSTNRKLSHSKNTAEGWGEHATRARACSPAGAAPAEFRVVNMEDENEHEDDDDEDVFRVDFDGSGDDGENINTMNTTSTLQLSRGISLDVDLSFDLDDLDDSDDNGNLANFDAMTSDDDDAASTTTTTTTTAAKKKGAFSSMRKRFLKKLAPKGGSVVKRVLKRASQVKIAHHLRRKVNNRAAPTATTASSATRIEMNPTHRDHQFGGYGVVPVQNIDARISDLEGVVQRLEHLVSDLSISDDKASSTSSGDSGPHSNLALAESHFYDWHA